MTNLESESESPSVVSDSLQPHGLYSPWNSPGQNTGVDSLSLLHGILTNLDCILKSRDITLLTNVCIVKAMIFLVVMYGCESWTIKKVECQRIDAFILWCWKKLLRVPRIARSSNLSTLKEINPEYSLEGLMLKLKLQYFSHLM